MSFPVSPSAGQIYTTHLGVTYQYDLADTAWKIIGIGMGTSGYSGAMGGSGYSGISGFSGYSGISGFSGYSGASGYSGVGTSGYSGNGQSGYSGAGQSGYSGAGQSGYSGSIGNSGYSGSIGASGYSGEGTSGYSGVGISGYSGAVGTSGYSGVGSSGYSGAQGASGYSGISGFSGYSGISGFSGYSGQSGYSGAVGTSGYSGISGFSGYSGKSGYSGISGFSGYSGISGFSGYSGISGFSGYSGKSGYSGIGTSGYSGISGAAGAAGAYWRALTLTYISTYSFSVVDSGGAGNYLGILSRGTPLKWAQSSAVRQAMVATSTSGTNTITVTTIGDIMVSSAASMMYATDWVKSIDFCVAGTLIATTDIAGHYYAPTPLHIYGADARVGTEANTTTVDINLSGTSMFATKLALATAASAYNYTADNLATAPIGGTFSIDIDSVGTTAPSDLYVSVYVFPENNKYR
jgi:hypothetical protein